MISNEWNAIAISGEAGSGKTALAELVGSLLGWEDFGGGKLFREWTARNAIDTLGAQPGQDGVHNDIDALMLAKLREGSSVVEGRVAGLVAFVNELPNVLKVLLVCEAEERYERIFARDGDKYATLDLVRQITQTREAENLAVFTRRYNWLSYLDPGLYDLVIDSGVNDLEGCANLVLQGAISVR